MQEKIGVIETKIEEAETERNEAKAALQAAVGGTAADMKVLTTLYNGAIQELTSLRQELISLRQLESQKILHGEKVASELKLDKERKETDELEREKRERDQKEAVRKLASDRKEKEEREVRKAKLKFLNLQNEMLENDLKRQNEKFRPGEVEWIRKIPSH